VSRNQYNWSQKSLDELVDFVYTEIRPAMIVDGYEPDGGWPRYEWLADNGFGGIVYTLREHHDLTLTQFFTEEMGLGNATPGDGPVEDVDDYEWGIRNEETVDAITSYLATQKRRGELAESTIETRRYRLARYARIYEELHGPVSLTRTLGEIEKKPAENDRCMEVFDVFKDQLGTDQSRLKYLSDVQQFYDHLVDFEGARFNPLLRANKQFNWEIPDPDNQPVDRESMRAIYAEADTAEEELLVLALGAGGLRPNEVASANASQFVFDSLVDVEVEAALYDETVVVSVTDTDGDPVGATVTINDDSVGTPDEYGEVRHTFGDTSSTFSIGVTHEGVTQTSTYRIDDARLVDQNDPADSYMVFEERKNGPGEVTLLFGVDAAQRRLQQLYFDGWRGYLFPSTRSTTGHISAKTVNARFKRLAERAGVTVDGQTPTAKMCRRFWYSTYNEAVKTMMEGLEGIAEDQGSASTEVVAKNYLSEAEERRYRRESMHKELAAVFEKDDNGDTN